MSDITVRLATKSVALGEVETTILQLMYSVEIMGMEIAATLHELDSSGLWRDKTDDDGRFPKNFGTYLDMFGQQLKDAGVKASSGTLQDLLSFYRLYHLELGLDLRTIMRLGRTNLDEVRKVIDWDKRLREIGPGTETKMNRDQAKTYLLERVAEMDTVGIPSGAIRSDVNTRLGREPMNAWVAVVQTQDGRCYLTDLVLWDGPTAYRPKEGIPEEKMRWLLQRLRAKVKWIEK